MPLNQIMRIRSASDVGKRVALAALAALLDQLLSQLKSVDCEAGHHVGRSARGRVRNVRTAPSGRRMENPRTVAIIRDRAPRAQASWMSDSGWRRRAASG